MKKILSILMGLLLTVTSLAGGLITPEELNNIKENENVVVLDYRWDEIPAKTIEGAQVILNAEIARKVNDIGGMVVSKTELETVMSSKGIKETDTVVIVDDSGMMNAGRLWWVLKLYGHEGDIYVVDGQIMAWEKAGLPMSAPIKATEKTNYKAKEANRNLVATIEEVEQSIDNPKVAVIDTRTTMERIKGHIPNSTYIEWKNNITEDGKYKSKGELEKIYADAGITKDLDAIMPHCKSAVRSTQTMFALVEILGYDNVKNYDGSWLEYGASTAPKSYGK